MKRILVLTTIERAFYSSVIEYQLLEPIVKLSRNNRQKKFIYIGLIPLNQWFSRGDLFGSFLSYKRNRRRIKDWLNDSGIYCDFLPILFPLRCKDFYLRIFWLILYLLNSVPILIYLLLRHKIDLVHSRNYPATLSIYAASRFLGIPYIFDMRDVYPEKGIEAGIFTDKSWSYKLWKRVENRLLMFASYVITTSEPFKSYIDKKVHPSKVIFLPNCVNPGRFKFHSPSRRIMKDKHRLGDRFVLLHSGAFGTPKDIPFTLKYFLHFKNIKPESYLLILSAMGGGMVEKINKAAKDLGIKGEDFKVLSLSPGEVPQFLFLGDVGLHLETMAIATPYGIGVKDGEYLASGLPIIVTKWQEGIAGLVECYRAGIIVDDSLDSTKKELQLLKEYESMRDNGFKLVEEVLSLGNNVKRLSGIYL